MAHILGYLTSFVSHVVAIIGDTLVALGVTLLGQTLVISITVVAQQLVTFTNDRLRTQIGTTAAIVYLILTLLSRIVNSFALY